MRVMVRNIKMSWGTRLWIRRHRRRHGNVLIRKHCRAVALTDAPGVVCGILQGTAHCECGESRPAYIHRTYGVDPAGVPA